MLQHYKPTPLEQWIENLWRRAGIVTPSQLTVDEAASRLNVWVHYLNQKSKALEYMGLRSILVDKRLNRAEQWQEFLHELCHVLRHAGNQTLMPRPFLESQEADANRFVLYAAIPYFMLREFHLPNRRSDAAERISVQFGVTHKLAYQRLEQIERRTFEAVLWEEFEKLSL
ncbi:ImmA/IrrE family metallo-endopeptidase [Cohnella lubricantis]|uniref:ImmA/IrrE family metallo-endopeptidase n=1 Tax=Cohnella lubricantis TaxID=2163172 RepID=A0A841THC7_9BACL|nr:ImmA/IrrE family metallo-endopeptidase [Cohnella lubricantis]MBB6678650.1 ImmA/IrrE family metallo-endopeptidase [Cohnella lubricantis]MBP2119190.1 Zn-dependent peptidase ImmA (M78 family) [Cohnella lubricantis]